MHIVLNRKIAVAAGALLAGAVAWGLWSLQPDRRLARAWGELLDMTEARRAAGLGSLLDEHYYDRWGYTRETLIEDMRLAFFHFDRLEVKTSQVEIIREGDQAKITAIIRFEVDGSPQATEGRVTINSLFDPFTFYWQRRDSFPWSWELVRIDHPQLKPRRFQGYHSPR